MSGCENGVLTSGFTSIPTDELYEALENRVDDFVQYIIRQILEAHSGDNAGNVGTASNGQAAQ